MATDPSPQFQSDLRGGIVHCFSTGELKALCADLDIDYESLAGEGKERKALELILYMKRRGQLKQLLDYCASKRREYTWPEEDASPRPSHNIIPTPPEPYIAHPYPLQTKRIKDLIGRRADLNQLNEWVSNPRSELYLARVLSVIGIGGIGKSALTWKWFNDIAPNVINPLDGRMWWSFYESDATFESFIKYALAYTTGRRIKDLDPLAPEREAQLFDVLDHRPFLLVLDGFERSLRAYAHLDAAHIADNEIERRNPNAMSRMATSADLVERANQSFIERHQERKTSDLRGR